ncbi:MAG: histidine--tRNA ligase [Oscillospiraceae bacterium]|nr:histidine--tRNA ligase [Ruminococcus sp.]MBQ9981779.1 histidine--tRNA ligase [Oscillospiraceae bacterium]
MALIVQRPLGTADVTPAEIHKWYTVEQIAQDTAQSYGFKEIRFPTFENTDLFLRSVGETTDVVQKEMYSVIAKESKFTLRPEGTAGTIRSVMQNGMLNDALPQKVFYITSCFRHERPQAGRLREFHQFGAEMIGSSSPYADAEMIMMADNFLKNLGLKNIELNINSIGCPKCRSNYHKALRAFFEEKKEELCETCHSRLEKNPMRILDCKSPICSGIAKDAPLISDYLCEECSSHFEKLKNILDSMNIKYVVNPKIVRGLDYYTKTVFEFITTDIGAQGTVCAGGRYDGLVEQLGGAPTPALGFAAGLERLIMTMEKQECAFMPSQKCDLYIVTMGEKALDFAVSLANSVRDEGLIAEYDLMNRSLKAQMKYANKIGADFTVVIGDNEIESGKANLKNMATGQQTEIALDEKFAETFSIQSISLELEGEENLFN